MEATIRATNGAMEQIGSAAQQQQTKNTSSLRIETDWQGQGQTQGLQTNGESGDSVSLSEAALNMVSSGNESLNSENMGDDRAQQALGEQNQPLGFPDLEQSDETLQNEARTAEGREEAGNQQPSNEQSQPVAFSGQGQPVYGNQQEIGQGINAII